MRGVCPFGAKEVAVLTIAVPNPATSDDGDEDDSVGPELHIVDRNSFQETAVDMLPIHTEAGTTEFILDCLPHDNLFFIVAPKDVVQGKPTTVDDHIDWLLAHKRYEEALVEAERCRAELERTVVEDVGEQYLNYLITKGECVRCDG